MNFRDKKLSFGIVYIGIIVLFSLLGLYFNLANFIYSLFDSDSISIILYLSLILGLTTILDFISSKNLNNYKDHSKALIFFLNLIIFSVFYISINILNLILDNYQLILTPIKIFIYCIIMQIFIVLSQNIVSRILLKKEAFKYQNYNFLKIKNSPLYMTYNVNYSLSLNKYLVPSHWFSEKKENYEFYFERIILMIKENSYLKVLISSIIINSIISTIVIDSLYFSSFNFSEIVINLSLISNLICFFYILVLPKISQWGIMNIDNKVRKKNEKIFKENLNIFEQNQDKNDRISKKVENIFYPVPSIHTRENNKKIYLLTLPNISRVIIFFMIFNLSIIFKGVHGNAGKPLNWFFPPVE